MAARKPTSRLRWKKSKLTHADIAIGRIDGNAPSSLQLQPARRFGNTCPRPTLFAASIYFNLKVAKAVLPHLLFPALLVAQDGRRGTSIKVFKNTSYSDVSVLYCCSDVAVKKTSKGFLIACSIIYSEHCHM